MEKKTAELKVNSKIYSKEIIYSAIYVFLDDGYFLLEGDPEKEIVIKIFEKNGKDPEAVKSELMNEMISYGSYFSKLKENKEAVKVILEKALFSANPALIEEAEENEMQELLKELDEEEADEIKETIKELKNDSKE